MATEFGWDCPGRPRSETDVAALHRLKEFAIEAKLVRRHLGSLRLTGPGRRGLADPAVLWQQAVTALTAGRDFATALRELLLIRLLQGAGERGPVERELLPVLQEARWRPSDGGELTAEMVSFELREAVGPMDLLGMLDRSEWPDRTLQLTELGLASARAILWQRATAPQTTPW